MTNAGLAELIAAAEHAYATRLTGEYAAAVVQLRAAADDWEPTIRRLLRDGRVDDAMRVVIGLGDFWLEGGRVAEGYELAVSALRAAGEDEVDSALRARTMLTAGELTFRTGDRDGASAWSERAARAAGAAGDHRTAGLAEVNLARVAFHDGDAERIAGHARRALEEAPDDRLVQRGAWHMLGWAAYTAGDRGEAIRWFEQSMEARAELGDEAGVAVELANLGDMATEAGELARAAGYLRRSTLIARKRGDIYLLLAQVASIGVLAAAAERWTDTVLLLAAAETAYATTSLVPDPTTRQVIDAAARKAGAQLGEEQVLAAQAAGRQLTLDQAIERALELCIELE